MIYSAYLERLLGNKTKVAILRAFFNVPEKVWTSRDLGRFIGTYNTTVLDNLKDLEDMGLVEAGRHGRVKMIKVNESSFVFNKIVKPLFEAEKKTLDLLIKDLKSIIPEKSVKLLAVFGSIAEHKEKMNSDIDLIIVTDNKEKIEKLITGKQDIISRKYGNEISPYILSTKEFRRKQKIPFILSAKKSHIILHGEWK